MNIGYLDYDKISDDMMFLAKNTIVRFNLTLSKKYRDNNRYHFHREYTYDSKYSDYGKVVSIKRTFNYYLSIDRIDDRNKSVMIRIQDIILLRAKLIEISTWFSDGTFVIKNNKLQIYKKKKPIEITNLAENKFILFEPIVIDYENSNTSYQGIRITLSDMNTYSDITIDNFYGFMYLINTIDMFGYAQNMLNYIQRPDYGTNLVEFNLDEFYKQESFEEPSYEVKARKRQSPITNKRKSVFDSMDGI